MKTIFKFDYLKVKCVPDIDLNLSDTLTLHFTLAKIKIEPERAKIILAGKLGLEYLNVLQFGTRAGVRPWCDRVLLLLAAQVD